MKRTIRIDSIEENMVYFAGRTRHKHHMLLQSLDNARGETVIGRVFLWPAHKA
jgi:hypothetical protein